MPVAKYASFCSLTLDSKQRPHISYADSGTAKGSKLRYASWDGLAWKTQAIPLNADVIAYYTSIALDKEDKPVISYYEYEGPGGIGFVLRLRVVSWNGKYWEARTVDQSGGSGKFNSIAVDSAGHPHLAYANVKAETSGLRYAQWDGQSWKNEVLEGQGGPYPIYSVALALDRNDTPHITYMDLTQRVAKYATRRDGKWQLHAVASFSREAYPDRNGITVDDNGNPYFTYYDASLGVLKLAYKTDNQWITEVVDRDFAGFTSSVEINNDTIWITYADESGARLKCARKPLRQAANNEHVKAAPLSRTMR
jgi:hypothetical protein